MSQGAPFRPAVPSCELVQAQAAGRGAGAGAGGVVVLMMMGTMLPGGVAVVTPRGNTERLLV